MITDKQIFEHIALAEQIEECEKCDGDIKDKDCGYYKTYECLNCGYSPEPEEEE